MERTVQYRRPDGSLTTDRSAAIRVTPGAVRQAVAGSIVVPSYFDGSAKHEAGYAINEVDTEESGFKTYGIFQISEEEANRFGGLGEWWTLEGAARVFVPLVESNLRNLLGWIKKDLTEAPRDVWAYLALYHNQGAGAAKKTIDAYGLNWSSYKSRNPGARINAYGDDCLPGGLGPGGAAAIGGGLIALALLLGGALLFWPRRVSS